MGVVRTVGFDRMPQQGAFTGKRVRVCFNYDTTQTISGTIVRDDREEPFVTVISLDDGRVILAQECQYALIEEPR